MSTITITTGIQVSEDIPKVADLRSVSMTGVDQIVFAVSETVLGVLNWSQLSALSMTTQIVGDEQENYLAFQIGAAGVYDFDAATNFTYSNWTEGEDYIAIFGSSGSDTIYGSAASEIINGEFDLAPGDGNDVLHGRGGNDILEGWQGLDQLYGDEGNDTLIAFEDNVVADEVFDGGADYDTLFVTTGGTMDLRNVALLSIEKLDISGFEELGTSKVLLSSTCLGGINLASNLHVAGTSVVTDLIEITSAGGTVDLSAWTFTNWVATSDTITVLGSGIADLISGSSQRDVLYGGAGNDTINGGAGHDTLYGDAGNDALSGGLGNDIYYVDAAGDTAVEDIDAGTDTLYASRSWAVGSNIERVYLTGTGDFNVAGNGLANTLKGNSGDNWLNGSFGKDTLTGGGGRDSFIFNRALGPNNIDTITDYDVVRDVIRIDNAVFTGIGAAGALAAGAFNTGVAATQADDRIIYDQTTGKLFFDVDGLGGAAQVHFATLSTKPAGMTAGEFIII